MKRLAAAAILLALVAAGCASEKAARKADEKLPPAELWELMREYKKAPENPLWIEDDWYVYKVELFAAKSEQKSAIFSSCPIGKANYVVWDKDTDELLHEESLSQSRCERCHKR